MAHLLDAVPDRLLWGSDRPHVAAPNGSPTPDGLRAEIAAWLPDPDLEIMSDALGTPVRDLRAAPDAWAEDLVAHGLSPAMATSLTDMFATIERGRDMGREPRNPLPCPTTLASWTVEKLAPAVRAARSGR